MICREANRVAKAHRLLEFRHPCPPRLLAGLEQNAAPSLDPFDSGLCEPLLGTLGVDRHKAAHSELRALFQYPFEPVKLDDRDEQLNGCPLGLSGKLFEHAKRYLILVRCLHFGKVARLIVGDLVLLAALHAKYSGEMTRLVAPELGMTTPHRINEEEPPRHVE